METLTLTYDYRHNVEIENAEPILKKIAEIAKSDNYQYFEADGMEKSYEIHQILESLVPKSVVESFRDNPISAIWITNSLDIIERAMNKYDKNWKKNLAALRGE